MKTSPEPSPCIDVCTLGMFIIDDIHFNAPAPIHNDYRGNGNDRSESAPGTQKNDSGLDASKQDRVLENIMGGAGSYTALGARVLAGKSKAKNVGWIVDCGMDFPLDMRSQISNWGTSCLFRETPDRLTTHGWNGYGTGERRAFKYTTAKLRLDEHSLTLDLLGSKSFHLICSPTRCLSLVEGIMQRRGNELRLEKRPLFIWEPIPDLCMEEEWEACIKALRMVDVVSPNHIELAGFFGKTEEDMKRGTATTKKEYVEILAMEMVRSGIGPNSRGHMVVRMGASGCCAINGHSRTTSWLPAYHRENSDNVVDPTGAGNTFLGGLAMALANGQSLESAAAYASIVAGVAIEQIGMPTLENDKWNGMSLEGRCNEYKRRLQELDVGVDVNLALAF